MNNSLVKEIFYLNQQGKRKNIEDHLYPAVGTATTHNRVFLVCDGVGGESKGEEASRIVCETVGNYLNKQPIENITSTIIKRAVHQAIEAMGEYIEDYPEAQNMSTTLTLVVITSKGVWVAWCGDSRVYHIRNGRTLWRTKDHSLVQQLIDAGDISETEATTHPRKNIILRSINTQTKEADIEIHFINNMQKSDYLLLCTDGLLENIGDKEIKQILLSDQKEKDKVSLFNTYCFNKTNDNYSMYLIQLNFQVKSFKKLITIMVLMVTILLVTTLSYYFFYFKTKDNHQSKNKETEIKNNSNNIPLPKMK